MTMATKLTGPELVPAGKIKHAVIFLHGLGSNGDDLLGLAPIMADGLPAETAFFAPNAPLPTPFSAGGYQWFEYWDRTPLQIIDGIKAAIPLIVDYVEEICTRLSITHENVVLCGFSQGTMMSLHVGLRKIDNLGGIIGFSGLLMSPESLLMEKLSKLPPVLLVHGLQDTVVPAAASLQAEMAIKALGGDVTHIQRPNLQHSIDEVGIREAVAFCQKVFK